MARNALIASTRKQAGKEGQAQKLGVIVSEVAEQIAMRDIDRAIGQEETTTTITALLTEAISFGLTCDKDSPTGDMLKAPSKSNPGELWQIFVDAINAPRIAFYESQFGVAFAEMTAEQQESVLIKKTARDNYLSRIRAFVRAGGAEPLDLYGNLAAAKMQKAAKKNKAGNKTGDAAPKETEVAAHTRTIVNPDSFAGATPLLAFLQEWIDANDADKAAASYKVIIGMADDLLVAVQQFIADQNAKKNKK